MPTVTVSLSVIVVQVTCFDGMSDLQFTVVQSVYCCGASLALFLLTVVIFPLVCWQRFDSEKAGDREVSWLMTSMIIIELDKDGWAS